MKHILSNIDIKLGDFKLYRKIRRGTWHRWEIDFKGRTVYFWTRNHEGAKQAMAMGTKVENY